MHKSLAVFQNNIREARELASLYDFLQLNVKAPISFDDLLRSQIVYSVSAFDKLIHDLVRIGTVDIFIGKRSVTNKYLNESISLAAYNSLSAATMPPKEYFFEQHIVNKLKRVSYQDPDNVADGLSYIWNEPHKWNKIAASMGLNETTVRTQLRLIVDRRNAIVHEADIDLATGQKFPISKTDSDATVVFLESCGEKIVQLVA